MIWPPLIDPPTFFPPTTTTTIILRLRLRLRLSSSCAARLGCLVSVGGA